MTANNARATYPASVAEPVQESREERAAALYRAANACCDTDLKTAIELRQLAGRIERGEDA